MGEKGYIQAYLELKAVFLALRHFRILYQNQAVLIVTDCLFWPIPVTVGYTTCVVSGAVFTNIPNLSPILVIKFMIFVLVKIGPNLVFTKHVLARTIFLILS